MKTIETLLLLLFISGCQSPPELTARHYPIDSPEEKKVSNFLGDADIIVSLGYAGSGCYIIGRENTYGTNLMDIEAAVSTLTRKRLAVINEQINYSPEDNDPEKAKLLSILRSNSFDMVVITSGTGNTGGTRILEIIRGDDT